MTLEMVNHLYKQLKKMKCDIVMVIGEFAYGADISFSILKQMPINNPDGYQICTNMNTLKTLIENNLNPDLYKPQLMVNFYYNSIMSRIENIYRIEYCISYNKPIIHVDNCREDENFMPFEKYKATDGTFVYRSNNYCAFIYKGLLNLNKSDIVTMDVYQSCYNHEMTLCRYRVHKNKSLYIDHFVAYRNLK